MLDLFDAVLARRVGGGEVTASVRRAAKIETSDVHACVRDFARTVGGSGTGRSSRLLGRRLRCRVRRYCVCCRLVLLSLVESGMRLRHVVSTLCGCLATTAGGRDALGVVFVVAVADVARDAGGPACPT